MRVSSRGYFDVIKTNLAAPSDRMNQLYGQLTSGKKLEKLSDDPLAATRAVRAQAGLEELTARKFVVQQGQRLLAATDSALGSISTNLGRCKDLMLSATSPTLDEAARSALAEQIRSLSSETVVLGNTEVQGQYIFAGSQVDTPPLREDATANLPVLYLGNHQQLAYQITPAEQTAVGFNGAKVFNYTDAAGQRSIAVVDKDIFSLLNDVANVIERGDTSQLAELTEQIGKCQEHVVGLRGQVGVMSQRYERAAQAVDDADLQLRTLLSNEQDVDYTSAIVDLRSQETAYQAALSMTSRMLDMPSLFDLSR